MKVYEVGEQGKPVLMLFPGTGCYWRSNFGKVIEPLAENFVIQNIPTFHTIHKILGIPLEIL